MRAIGGSSYSLARIASVTATRAASLSCCNFAGGSGSPYGQLITLGRVHLLRDGFLVTFVSEPLEALALELGELDAVGGVGAVEVKHGPDQDQAAGLAGEAADHLGAALDLAERSFEQVGRSPAPAVSGRVAQVHDERVEVVGEAARGGAVAGPVELVDERLQSLLAVALVGRVVERLPVGAADAFALAVGQLGEQVADAVHGAVLAIRGGPALLDRLDQPGRAVGDDQQRRAEPARDQVAREREPVLV